MIETQITKLLGVRHPVLCAPMAGVAGGELAAAVSAAGGFGCLGGGYGDGEWLASQLETVDPSILGIGFITWRLAEQPDLLDVALSYRPKAIFLSFGNIAPFSAAIKAANTLLIAQVQNLADARAAASAGADIIVAQGTEAGGHGGQRATLPLVPVVVDAVAPIPVLAAGGIADGRGLAASLLLGASGVVMGTRFYCTAESLAPIAAQARVIAANGDNTIRSSVFDLLRGYAWPKPYNLRTIENEMTRKYADAMDELGTRIDHQRTRFEQSVADGDYDIAAVIAGEAIDLIDNAPPVADLMVRIVAEAELGLRKPDHFSLIAH